MKVSGPFSRRVLVGGVLLLVASVAGVVLAGVRNDDEDEQNALVLRHQHFVDADLVPTVAAPLEVYVDLEGAFVLRTYDGVPVGYDERGEDRLMRQGTDLAWCVVPNSRAQREPNFPVVDVEQRLRDRGILFARVSTSEVHIVGSAQSIVLPWLDRGEQMRLQLNRRGDLVVAERTRGGAIVDRYTVSERADPVQVARLLREVRLDARRAPQCRPA